MQDLLAHNADAGCRAAARTFFCVIAGIALLACGPAEATYTRSTATFNYIATTTHTAIMSWPGCNTTSGDDSLSAPLNIGFTFNFGGINYTQVRVMTNGRLQFDNTFCGYGTATVGPPRTYPYPIPDSNLNRTIRIYGADLDVSSAGSGTITYSTIGAAPNRMFVVTWNNVSAWQSGGSNNFGQGTAYNLQIQLHESGDFNFMYGVSDDRSEPANQIMGPAQIGWQLSTTDYQIVQSGLPADNTGWRFSLPSMVAEYRFDQGALSGVPGEVLDSSQSGLHGTRINSPTNSLRVNATLGGRVCQALTVPGSNGTNQRDAVDTGLTPTNIGSTGAITFWYRSNAAWGTSENILFDATLARGEDFYLSRDNNGRLRFVVTDSNRRRVRLVQSSGNAFPAGTWAHIALSWSLTGGAMRLALYVNGALTTTVTDSSSGALANSLGSLYIGDNRSDAIELSNDIRAADGLIDEFRIYNSAATLALVTRDMAITRSCSSLDHLALSHAGTGVTCEATPVQVSAQLADHSTYTAYQGTVTLSTSTSQGDWSLVTGSGTLANGTANDGIASYTFVSGDSGIVALGLSHTRAGTVNVNVTDGVASERGGTATAAEDADIQFADAGFAFLANGTPAAIGMQIAGKGSNTAPNAQTLELQAIRTDSNTGTCVAALAGTRLVDLAFECVAPATCAGGSMTMSGASTANIAGNSGTVTAYTPVSLLFDAVTGRAPLSFVYSDAGSVRLHARHVLALEGLSGVTSTLTGSSNAFPVRPFALHFAVTGNPGASSASGSRFTTAGTRFNGSLRAVAWSAADDANRDGIADGHESTDLNAASAANLADNTLTPNFTPGVATALTARLVEPAGGNAPALADTTTATVSNGVAGIAGMRYDEVGIVELAAAQSGDYLGMGAAETAKIRGVTGHVGRFYPARFAVSANVPSFADSCGAFTYFDQGFVFDAAPVLTVTALNTLGAVTRNYTSNGFFKFTSTLAGRSYRDTSGATAGFTATTGGAVTRAGDTGLTGSFTLSLPAVNGDRFAYQRTRLAAPFAANVTANFTPADLTDSDNACYDPDQNGTCDTFSIAGVTGADLRFGRLYAGNAYGSELLTLPVPARVEYYTGSGFVVSADDTCTAITTGALNLGIDGVANTPAPGIDTVALGGGTSTAAIRFAPAIAGELGMTFSPPGARNVGDIDYQFDLSLATGAAAEWLRYDWNEDGAFDEDPTGRVSFGIFGGNAAVIYVREPWQ